MRALRYFEYGGPEVLRLDHDAPIPEAGPGQILVKVAGAGVNPADWKIREGLSKDWRQATFPATEGHEFSGTVERLGPGVTEFSIGDEVYGIADGSCADFVAAEVSAAGLRPPSMDAADAGGVPLACMTAWQALFDKGGLKPGMKVLIQAASGGVGTFAVQIAKWGGAYVIGTCSAKNAHLVQELGADQIIDYKTQDYANELHDLDLVIETSTQNLLKSLGVLNTGGTLVNLYGGHPDEDRQERAVKYMSMEPKTEQLTKIANLIEDLNIRPVIDTVAPFERAIDLQKESQAGHVVGKLVVRLNG